MTLKANASLAPAYTVMYLHGKAHKGCDAYLIDRLFEVALDASHCSSCRKCIAWQHAGVQLDCRHALSACERFLGGRIVFIANRGCGMHTPLAVFLGLQAPSRRFRSVTMVVSGMEYSELQRRNQIGRLKQKLAAKQAAAAAATGDGDGAKKADDDASDAPQEGTLSTQPTTPSPAAVAQSQAAPVDEETAKAAQAAMDRIQAEQERLAEKAAKGEKAVTAVWRSDHSSTCSGCKSRLYSTFRLRCQRWRRFDDGTVDICTRFLPGIASLQS